MVSRGAEQWRESTEKLLLVAAEHGAVVLRELELVAQLQGGQVGRGGLVRQALNVAVGFAELAEELVDVRAHVLLLPAQLLRLVLHLLEGRLGGEHLVTEAVDVVRQLLVQLFAVGHLGIEQLSILFALLQLATHFADLGDTALMLGEQVAQVLLVLRRPALGFLVRTAVPVDEFLDYALQIVAHELGLLQARGELVVLCRQLLLELRDLRR